jgi:sigma-B regulation protein RsbU (phosphoserine phosphatase)
MLALRESTAQAHESLLKVVVAEDNMVQRKYLMRLVENLGYQAIPAVDGMAALELLQTTKAQILLSDYRMPNLDGIALTREIRKLDLGRYIHVIMITGNGEDDLRVEALEAGVDDFVTKGANMAILKARMRTATRLIRHEAELAAQNTILRDAHERIQTDLTAAAAAQRNLLPEFHDTLLGFRISSIFVPSSFVSGDMFGCFPLDEKTLGFYAVDVSGHGVHASLLSVAIGHLITPEFFKSKVLKDAGAPDPAFLVDDLNKRFCKSSEDEYFSMFCGVIDRDSGRLIYCQAAYPSPYYVDRTGNVQLVGDGGFPVGMFYEAEFENNAITIETGSFLVICSDAAMEAEDIAGQPFGSDRLKNLVAKSAKVGTEEMPSKIVGALSTWRDNAPLEDDLTVVTLERTESYDSHHVAST